MEFDTEAFAGIKRQIEPLIKRHWEEIALNKDAIKLNPDWKEYARLSDSGALRIYTAREDGELVGYFVVIVSKSIHYKDHLFANNDIIFIDKEHRKGTAGIRLIKYAVEQLEAEGITLININTKVHQAFDVVLERQGFNLIERVYSKRVN